MCSEQKVHGLRSASTINCVKRSKFEIISNYISDNGRLTNANASFNRALEAVFCVDFYSDRENNSWEKNCRLRRPLCGTKPTQFTVICAHKLFQQLGHSMWSLFCIFLSTFHPTELPTDILCNLVDNKWRFSCANYFRQMGHFPFLWFDQISYILNSLLGVFFPYL